MGDTLLETLSCPQAEGPASKPPLPTDPPAPRTGPILVVDDDAMLLESTAALVSHLGHIPVLAARGEIALDQLEAGLEPRLVILDMDMPGLGGAGTLPRLRALRPDLPVVISTGGVHPQVPHLLHTFPLVSLMPKPYGLSELRGLLA